MKRLSFALAPVFALGTLIAAYSEDARPTHSVARGPLAVTLDLDGSYDSPELFEAKFRPDGYGGELSISKIASHGAAVKKGDVVLQFDPAPWQRAVAAAENELRAADAGLKAASDSCAWGDKQDSLTLANSKDAVLESEKELEYFNTIDGPHMLKYNELGLKNYEDNVKDQAQELEQLEKMYKSEELTTDTADIVRDRAKRSLENSKIFLEMRRASSKKTPDWEYPRRKIQVERAVEQSKVGLAQTESNVANGKVQRDAQKVRATAAREQQVEALEKLKRDGDKLTITSSIDGWAIYGQLAGGNWSTNDELLKAYRTGEKVGANVVVLTVIPSGAKMARVAIPEDRAMQAKVGQKATVAALGSQDKKLEATLSEISPVPSGGVIAAKLQLSSAAESVVPGMKCKVSIAVADLKDVVLVPASAVGVENGKPAVWVMEGGKEKVVEITLGMNNGQWHEVKAGLKGGETILQNALKK
ncbi:MAG: HlyD family efflux transporter periplasmic adaptor subunit [Planctomycetota bacterium]